MSATRNWDYIIVVGGSAGCVLANRLSEDPKISVLLLEAGGPDHHPMIRIPLGVGWLLSNPIFDWRLTSDVEPELFDRRLSIARGKVLGGSSSINMMTHNSEARIIPSTRMALPDTL